eukprot:6112567-Alexandrium_andersonii.AAC.1
MSRGGGASGGWSLGSHWMGQRRPAETASDHGVKWTSSGFAAGERARSKGICLSRDRVAQWLGRGRWSASASCVAVWRCALGIFCDTTTDL